jgi:ubiquinone/menaquinone biosynthesis C-methylase UbiE
MPHDFKDISGVAGVATRRTQEEESIARSREHLWGTGRGDDNRFANPAVNVHAMGIEPGMKVADFGAGSGAYALAAARIVGQSGRVYAVDVQKDLLSRIKNNAAEEGIGWLDVVWGDFEKADGSHIKDASVDVVVLSNTLFQIEHIPAAFAEARRVLKKNGRLVIIDWTDSFGGMGPEPQRVVSKEKATAHAHKAGFALFKEFTAGAHHYGIILKADSTAPSV